MLQPDLVLSPSTSLRVIVHHKPGGALGLIIKIGPVGLGPRGRRGLYSGYEKRLVRPSAQAPSPVYIVVAYVVMAETVTADLRRIVEIGPI